MRFALLLALVFSASAHGAAIDQFRAFVRGTQSARAGFEQKVSGRSRSACPFQVVVGGHNLSPSRSTARLMLGLGWASGSSKAPFSKAHGCM